MQPGKRPVKPRLQLTTQEAVGTCLHWQSEAWLLVPWFARQQAVCVLSFTGQTVVLLPESPTGCWALGAERELTRRSPHTADVE